MTSDDIIIEVARLLGVPPSGLLGKSRRRELADARAVVTYLLRAGTDYTLPRIGDILNCTHGAVIYNVNKVCDWLDTPRLNKDCVAACREVWQMMYPGTCLPRPRSIKRVVTDNVDTQPLNPIFVI